MMTKEVLYTKSKYRSQLIFITETLSDMEERFHREEKENPRVRLRSIFLDDEAEEILESEAEREGERKIKRKK